MLSLSIWALHALCSVAFSVRADNRNIILDFHIEKVSTKERALDVRIFRGFSISPAEFILKKHDENAEKGPLSEAEAIDQLMPGYDAASNEINHVSPHEREVYFAAVLSNQYKEEEEKSLCQAFARQNGVMGVVRTQVRHQDSVVSLEDMLSSNSTRCQAPHVYLSNLRIDDSMRRRGLATALLSAVTSYCRAIEGVNLILLSVDNDNEGAIDAYKKCGYRYVTRNDVFGTMYLEVS